MQTFFTGEFQVTKDYYVYILSNKHHTVFYTGVTNDIARRLFEHKNGQGGVFTSKYHLKELLYCEHFLHVENAIARDV